MPLIVVHGRTCVM